MGPQLGDSAAECRRNQSSLFRSASDGVDLNGGVKGGRTMPLSVLGGEGAYCPVSLGPGPETPRAVFGTLIGLYVPCFVQRV